MSGWRRSSTASSSSTARRSSAGSQRPGCRRSRTATSTGPSTSAGGRRCSPALKERGSRRRLPALLAPDLPRPARRAPGASSGLRLSRPARGRPQPRRARSRSRGTRSTAAPRTARRCRGRVRARRRGSGRSRPRRTRSRAGRSRADDLERPAGAVVCSGTRRPIPTLTASAVSPVRHHARYVRSFASRVRRVASSTPGSLTSSYAGCEASVNSRNSPVTR